VHFDSYLFTYKCSSQLHEHKQKLHISYLTIRITVFLVVFKNRLRTIKAENP